MVSKLGQMDPTTKDNGEMIWRKVEAILFLRMETRTMGISIKIWLMAEGLIHGRMEVSVLESGLMMS